MKKRIYKLCALSLASALSMAIFTGCSKEQMKETVKETTKETTAASENSTEASEDMELSDEDLAELMQGTFRPSDMVFASQDKYEFPYIGLSAVLPRSLMDRMDRKEVAMICDEIMTKDTSGYQYAYLSWNLMTDEQREAEVEKLGDGYYDWMDSLERIGTLGVYQKDAVKDLDTLTRCTEHKELGQSADGVYKYYLSTNPDVDQELTDEVKQIKAELTELAPFDLNSAFSENIVDPGIDPASVENLGSFKAKDIHGTEYTEEMFQDYDLTMVNLFTTWCTPCVGEIPDLQKLRDEMAKKGVNVIGVVLDADDGTGKINEEAVEKAKLIAEKTGASYPFLLPDETKMNGRLNNIDSVPETFFVDKDGNIVGETYVGSSSFEDWKSVVEKELSNLKGGN